MYSYDVNSKERITFRAESVVHRRARTAHVRIACTLFISALHNRRANCFADAHLYTGYLCMYVCTIIENIHTYMYTYKGIIHSMLDKNRRRLNVYI